MIVPASAVRFVCSGALGQGARCVGLRTASATTSRPMCLSSCRTSDTQVVRGECSNRREAPAARAETTEVAARAPRAGILATAGASELRGGGA
jgi:hypothetical protein